MGRKRGRGRSPKLLGNKESLIQAAATAEIIFKLSWVG